jgi:uracil-DNA glycosylase family 4
MTRGGQGAGDSQPPFASLGECRRCPRLAAHLGEVRGRHPAYHALPVSAFGDRRPKLLIVGLAPGLHGANRTGRPFTGDYAGVLLYATLHRFGWASRAESVATGDGLSLPGCRVTNAVKCLPPANKPEPVEVRTCNAYLQEELHALDPGAAVLALGRVAHGAVLMALGLRASAHAFGHGAEHEVPAGGMRLFDSYHCSRYNTQTKRLTAAMFEAVFARIADHLVRT